jgi:predicted dehydrogenase
MIRLGVIGASQIAEEHIAAAIVAGFEITGIAASPNSTNAKNLANKFGSEYFQNYQKLVGSRLNFDALLIATKPEIATHILNESNDLDCPILCEKPVSLNLKSLKSLEHISESLYVAYNRRFYPEVKYLKSAFDLSSGSATFRIFEPRVGSLEINGSNNPILNNSVHVLDLVGYLADANKLVESWVDSSHTVGRFIFENSMGGQVSVEIYLGYPGNTSLEVYSDEKVFQLKPLEKLTVFDGLKVELDDFGRRTYRPEILQLEGLDLSEHHNLKPGFQGMWREFYDLATNCENSNSLATIHESVNTLTKAIQISNKLYQDLVTES